MNKYIYTLLFLLISSFCFSQSGKFNEIKQTIEQKININLWDEVLILAPDLIIEEPTKGDGYYYTALAFQRLGNEDKAKKYIQKAKTLSDEQLSEKISQLERDMNAKLDFHNLEKQAMDYELNKNPREAANTWYKAWALEKNKIEYALKAVSHFIDLKAYEQALEVLNQPQVYQDLQAKELVKKINETPEIISLNGYNKSISEGTKYFNEEEYYQAKLAYEKALKFKPNDSYASSKKQESIEEIAWKKARESSYVEDTEKYADTYPFGKYIKKANDLIRRSYISIAESAFQQSNESQLVEYHNKFLKRFPGDDGISNIRNLLLRYYLKKGDSNLAVKDWYDAKKYFQAYLNISSYGIDADHCRKSIKKCDWKLKQRSTGFIAYSYDSISPIGISFGKLNKNGIGFYSTLKLNTDIFTGLNGTIDDAGNTVLDLYTGAQTHIRLNEIRNPNASISLGLTIKLVYPLYMYIGGGAIYTSVYDRWEATDPNYILQDVDRTYWLRNTDKTNFDFFPESGLILKVSNVLILKYGVIYNENLIHQFGLGFQL